MEEYIEDKPDRVYNRKGGHKDSRQIDSLGARVEVEELG